MFVAGVVERDSLPSSSLTSYAVDTSVPSLYVITDFVESAIDAPISCGPLGIRLLLRGLCHDVVG